MFNKLLNRFGYVKKGGNNTGNKVGDLTEEELTIMLVKLWDYEDEDVDEKEEEIIFKSLKQVEGFVQFLKSTANRDIKRYFLATTPSEQLMIRGSFSRTNYLRTKIVNSDK